MENKDPQTKPSTRDNLIKLTKGAVGAIPFVGGLAGELLDMAIVPQQQKKMNEWFEYVDETLDEVIQSGKKTKEEIFNDERFTSIFQKTSRAYINNVEAHKKPLLKAYLKASMIKETPLDKKYIFLTIIDDLTETHLLLLKEIYDNEKSANYLYQKDLEKILVPKYAGGNRSFYDLLIKGLQDHHLLSYWSANIVIDNENQWHMRISPIAKELFDYLSTDE